MSRGLGEKWHLIRHWQSNPSVQPISRGRLSPSLAFRRGTTYKQTRPDDMIWIIKYTVWKPSIAGPWPGFKWIIPFWGGRRLSVSYKISIDSRAGVKAQIQLGVVLSFTCSLFPQHTRTPSPILSLFLNPVMCSNPKWSQVCTCVTTRFLLMVKCIGVRGEVSISYYFHLQQLCMKLVEWVTIPVKRLDTLTHS